MVKLTKHDRLTRLCLLSLNKDGRLGKTVVLQKYHDVTAYVYASTSATKTKASIFDF